MDKAHKAVKKKCKHLCKEQGGTNKYSKAPKAKPKMGSSKSKGY